MAPKHLRQNLGTESQLTNTPIVLNASLASVDFDVFFKSKGNIIAANTGRHLSCPYTPIVMAIF